MDSPNIGSIPNKQFGTNTPDLDDSSDHAIEVIQGTIKPNDIGPSLENFFKEHRGVLNEAVLTEIKRDNPKLFSEIKYLLDKGKLWGSSSLFSGDPIEVFNVQTEFQTKTEIAYDKNNKVVGTSSKEVKVICRLDRDGKLQKQEIILHKDPPLDPNLQVYSFRTITKTTKIEKGEPH